MKNSKFIDELENISIMNENIEQLLSPLFFKKEEVNVKNGEKEMNNEFEIV
jgi:hypothetical protein